MDWTFRLRDRRLRRWVAYILAAVFAYPPHSASLPRSLRSRLAYPRYLSAMPSRAPQARISPSAWRNPPPPHSAPLYKTFTNPNSVYTTRQTKSLVSLKWAFIRSSLLSGAIFYEGFQCGVLRTSVYQWGLSIWCSVTLHVCLYMGAFNAVFVSLRIFIQLSPFYFLLLENIAYSLPHVL